MYVKAALGKTLALSVWASSALFLQATPIIFDFDSNTQLTGSTAGVGNYAQFTHPTGVVVTATAWYAPDATGPLTAAILGLYPTGLGVCTEADSCVSPNHAVDNNGGFDFVLLRLSSFSDLQRILIDWNVGGADVQYWVGNQANPNLQDLLIGDLASVGFTTSYVHNDTGIPVFDLEGGSGFSLLVSGRLDQQSNYFTITKLKLEPSEVPEPATYGLVGVALIGAAMLRRKRI